MATTSLPHLRSKSQWSQVPNEPLILSVTASHCVPFDGQPQPEADHPGIALTSGWKPKP